MSEVEHVAVTITVMGIEQVRGREPLIGLANVELDVAGVLLTLQGLQVLRLANGCLACKLPQFRRPNGVWAPAVVLQPELVDAIGSEVIQHLLRSRGTT